MPVPDKIAKSVIHDFANGEIVNEQILDTIFEIFRVAINDVWRVFNDHKEAATLDHPDGSITTVKIKDGAITTSKLADAIITQAKLADGSVSASKLQQAIIGTAHIIDGVITGSKLASKTITADKLVDGIMDAQYYNKAQVDAKLAQLVLGQIPANTITESLLAPNAVTSTKIAPGAVDATKVASDVATVQWVNNQLANMQSTINVLNTSRSFLERDFVGLALAVDVLVAGDLTGVDQNIVIETFENLDDVTVESGLYDAANHKLYLL